MMHDDIDFKFSSHKCDAETVKQMSQIRAKVRELAKYITSVCPPSRELSLAQTQLVTVMMFANQSLAHTCPIDENDFI